jgi:hypothetical protein
VEPDARVLLEEYVNQGCLMGRQVIEDDVNLLMRRAQRDDFFKKGDEVAAGMACGGFAVNTAGCGVQRGIQGERSVAVVFKTMALGTPGEMGNTGSSRSSA